MMLNRRKIRWDDDKTAWYRDKQCWVSEQANMMNDEERTIFVEYYHNVRSLTWIGMRLYCSDRTVKRKKRKILQRILE